MQVSVNLLYIHSKMMSSRHILALTRSHLRGHIAIPVRSVMDATKKVEDVVSVDVHAAKDLLSSDHRYLDVRTVEEFSKSHVDNALNVPYMFKTEEGRLKNPEFLSQVSSVCKKEDNIVVGCNSGGRSLKACVDLLNAGYGGVKNMAGGYSAWVDSGLAGQKRPEEMKNSCKFRR